MDPNVELFATGFGGVLKKALVSEYTLKLALSVYPFKVGLSDSTSSNPTRIYIYVFHLFLVVRCNHEDDGKEYK